MPDNGTKKDLEHQRGYAKRRLAEMESRGHQKGDPQKKRVYDRVVRRSEAALADMKKKPKKQSAFIGALEALFGLGKAVASAPSKLKEVERKSRPK